MTAAERDAVADRHGGRPRAVGDDAGSASVWAACAMAGLVVFAVAVWSLGAVVLVRHRAANAADLAALAAAGSAADGSVRACARADRVGQGMGVRVRECRLDGRDALVVVEAEPPHLLVRLEAVTARARAGPVDDSTKAARRDG